MRRVDDNDPLRWIIDATKPYKNKYCYGMLLPPTYEAYCKVFHPIYEGLPGSPRRADVSLQRLTDMIGDADLAQRMIDEGAEITFPPSPDERGVRVRWRDVAERNGLTFHAGLTEKSFEPWPESLVPPNEGLLDHDHLERIIGIIGPATRCHLVYVWHQAVHIWETDDEVTDVLLDGKLGELPAFMDEHDDPEPPTYWWPPDRSWCLCADVDLSFTMLGGPAGLIQRFLDDDYVEAMPVELGDRYHHDRLNIPKKDQRRLLKRLGRKKT